MATSKIRQNKGCKKFVNYWFRTTCIINSTTDDNSVVGMLTWSQYFI